MILGRQQAKPPSSLPPTPLVRKRVLTTPTQPNHTIFLRVQIPRHRPSQPPTPFPSHTDQILQIITRRDAELPDKILRRALQIPVLFARDIFFRTPKVRVAADGLRALEALQAVLCFGRGGGVEGSLAEEFVGADALLVAEFLARVLFAVVDCGWGRRWWLVGFH